MKTLMKHTATLVKMHLVYFLALTVMLSMLATAANASQSPQVSNKENNSTFLGIESEDCLIAGKRIIPRTSLPRPPTKPPPTPDDKKSAELDEESEDCMLAGVRTRKPTRRASPKKSLAAAKR